jgi:hypothetical protein
VRKGKAKGRTRPPLSTASPAIQSGAHGVTRLPIHMAHPFEIYPKNSIITVDVEDFRVYRRNKREIIPLISPP